VKNVGYFTDIFRWMCRRIRLAEYFSADIGRNKIRRLIRISAAACGSIYTAVRHPKSMVLSPLVHDKYQAINYVSERDMCTEIRPFHLMRQSNVYLHCQSKNMSPHVCPYIRQILTDAENSFTGTLCGKFHNSWLLNIPQHFNCDAPLHCKI